MLDFFAVITKGGLVLWYFQDAAQQLSTSIDAINSLIRNVILQERGGMRIYDHENLALQMKMDNEFELLYVAVYQKILQLSYVDKFLSDIQREFRDRYKEPLESGMYYQSFDFSAEFSDILRRAEQYDILQKAVAKAPRTFEQSEKSKKTIDSMIVRPSDKDKKNKKKDGGSRTNNRLEEAKQFAKQIQMAVHEEEQVQQEEQVHQEEKQEERYEVQEKQQEEKELCISTSNGDVDPKEEMRLKLEKLQKRGTPKAGKTKSPKQNNVKKGKEARVWELDGRDSTFLDYSRKTNAVSNLAAAASSLRPDFLPDPDKIGTMSGDLQGMEVFEENNTSKSSGMFSLFRNLVGGKTLTESDLLPVLEKLQDHLIGKNVAAEIAAKLCTSVQSKLQGKHIGTFEGVSSLVRSTLTESLVQLLTPSRRLDVLRDVRAATAANRPYAITFCGVNGVGKSTNLAKISFWLIENNFRVLIAACDTFRAGAVEQLRTHMQHLNALHPPSKHKGVEMVSLFEQGYGKDAAEIARHAIEHARRNDINVVLIDTAGRMQDNEPLMRALAKLIHVNEPDLTLFVGEALVGNEAVDQLVKFNRALANFASSTRTQMIDGIVLTKFDTIDDKVGAAISMTYITGQPIVFVGTGQTYTDLRNLDAKAVVATLMK